MLRALFIVLLLSYSLTSYAEDTASESEHASHEPAPSKGADAEDLPDGTDRVKLPISVSRFGEGNVTALVSYLFYFQTDDRSTKDKIYASMQWFKGNITPKLTEYLSNPAHNPKDITQVKRFMWRLTNRMLNQRYPKKDRDGKPKPYLYITDIFINKIFERKL